MSSGNKGVQKDLQKSKAAPELTAIILAAGKGTRMKSPLPKVLHPVAGRPMLEKVIQAVQRAGASEVRVVVGHGHALVQQIIEPMNVSCFQQAEQLGTAHAVKSAQMDSLEGDIIILNGDHPLIEFHDIKEFVRVYREEKLDLALITAELKNPGQLGRIVRHRGELKAVVEAKDASADTLKIREINTGIYILNAKILDKFLPQIKNHNSKGEYYLTDLISLCIEAGCKVQALKGNARVALGVNTQQELAKATKLIFLRKVKKLMDEGVVVIDPQSTYVEETVEVGPGSVLYPNCFLRGQSRLGAFCVVESQVFISDCKIGDSVQVRAGSYLERSEIQSRAQLGPYARIRPETVVGEEAHIGNFVELKKVKFGKRSKAGHLTYLGDAEIGEEVNIGCGTITCNYAADRKKYKTKIGDRVFVGSDTQFVAPLVIGDDAVIGSGSTLTKDVPANALAVARGKQMIKENYVSKFKTEETIAPSSLKEDKSETVRKKD